MKISRRLIFLGGIVLALMFFWAKAEPKPEVEISNQIDTLFRQLCEIEEQQRDTARDKWQGMSIQDRAWFLYPKAQELIPQPELSHKEAIEIIENAKQRMTEAQFKRLTETPFLLSLDEREEFDRKQGQIVEQIAALGEPAIPLLIARLRDIATHAVTEDNFLTKERQWTQSALVKIGKPGIVELLKLLEETLEKEQTEMAIAIMRHLRHVEAVELIPVATKYLEKALQKEQIPCEPTVQLIFSCSFTHSRDVVPLLIRAVECKNYVDKRGRKDTGPRIAAVKSLALIGDQRAAETLRAAAKAQDGYLRFSAVSALITCGNDKAIPLLEKIAKTDNYQDKGGNLIIRRAAKEALQAIRKRKEEEKLGMVLFSDGTRLAGKVFVNGVEEGLARIEADEENLIFISKTGQRRRCRKDLKANGFWISFVFVKAQDGWRPAMGETWPRLTSEGEPHVKTIVFGPELSEAEKGEFRDYSRKWIEENNKRERMAIGANIERRYHEKYKIHPIWDKWLGSSQQCYGNLQMIQEVYAHHAAMHNMILDPTLKQMADTKIEELCRFYYITPPKCPQGGNYVIDANVGLKCIVQGALH